MRLIKLCFVFLMCLSFNPKLYAFAGEDWQVSSGFGVLVQPEYEGSEDYEALPLPFANLRYKERLFFSVQDGLGYDWLTEKPFKLSTALKPYFGRDEDDNSRLQGLGDVDPSVEGVIRTSYQFSKFQVGGEFSVDLGSGHEGFTFEPFISSGLPLGEDTFLLGKLFTTYADNKYTESLFGINANQSANSGLTQHNTDGDFKDYGASITLNHKLSESWSLTFLSTYSKLINDAGSSPITEDSDQWSNGLFVSRSF